MENSWMNSGDGLPVESDKIDSSRRIFAGRIRNRLKPWYLARFDEECKVWYVPCERGDLSILKGFPGSQELIYFLGNFMHQERQQSFRLSLNKRFGKHVSIKKKCIIFLQNKILLILKSFNYIKSFFFTIFYRNKITIREDEILN